MEIQKRIISAVCCLCFITIVGNVLAEPKESDSFKFSMTVLTEVTDNRDSSADADNNVDVYLRPRISKTSSPDITRVEFSYAPSYRYRSNPSDIQNESELMQDVGMSIVHTPSPRVRLSLEERFNLTDDPAIHDDKVDRPDSTYILNRARCVAGYELDRRSSVDFEIKSTIKRYDEAVVARASDEDITGLDITYWRELQKDMGLLVTGGRKIYNYENYNELERGLNTTQGGIGIEKIINANARCGFRVGYTSAQYDDSDLGASSSPFGELSLQIHTIPSLRVNGGAGYSLKDADVYPFASQKQKEVYGRVEWEATPKIMCGGSMKYRIGEYDEDSLPPSALNDPGIASIVSSAIQATGRSGEKKTMVVSADVTYWITDSAFIKLEQRYEDTDSDVDVIYPSFTRNSTKVVVTRMF